MSSPNSRGVGSQTLERALDALQVLADARPRTSHELAEALGLHRSIVYRILRTFEAYGFVVRAGDGRYTLGLGLAVMAEAGLRDSQLRLDEVLAELANSTGATAVFCIRQQEMSVVLTSARPVGHPASVAIRRGTRLPLTDGAPGMALLALESRREYEADEISLARTIGYVHTKDSPFPGFEAVARAVRLRDGQPGSVAVVFPPSSLSLNAVLPALQYAARRIEQPAEVWSG